MNCTCMFFLSFQNLLPWFLLFPDDRTWCWKVWENMVKLMGFLQTKSFWIIERGFCIIALLLKSKKANYSAGISLNRLSDELIPAEVKKCHIFLCLMYCLLQKIFISVTKSRAVNLYSHWICYHYHNTCV